MGRYSFKHSLSLCNGKLTYNRKVQAMKTSDYLVALLGFCTLLGALAGGVRFLVKSYLSELKPNGGSSMRDAVNLNSNRLERLEERVDSIYEILCKK